MAEENNKSDSINMVFNITFLDWFLGILKLRVPFPVIDDVRHDVSITDMAEQNNKSDSFTWFSTSLSLIYFLGFWNWEGLSQ